MTPLHTLFAILFVLLVLAVKVSAEDITEQAAEYRRLRLVHGHFQGGPQWVKEVDSWGCRKQEVMNLLQKSLGARGTPESRITHLMGDPDERSKPGTPKWHYVRPAEGDSMLVYYWRGGHDFLYFTMAEGKVLKSGWWMAGE